jgi:hypothetical protein
MGVDSKGLEELLSRLTCAEVAPRRSAGAVSSTAPQPQNATASSRLPVYCDQKVANRETKVWHCVIENGY